jgi:hypothetical protein
VTSTDLAQRIRSRGHWNVTLRPNTFIEKRVKALADLEQALHTSHVALRSRDYPHLPHQGATRQSHFIQGVANWEHHYELWRLSQSAQFVHLFAMQEDWWSESRRASNSSLAEVKPGELLEVPNVLFTFTELFLFAARLVEALAVGPDIVLEYKLAGLAGRRLQILDPRRRPLHGLRMAGSDLTEYREELTIETSTLIASARELAIDQTLAVYERFNWKPARATLVEDQRRLIERRLSSVL